MIELERKEGKVPLLDGVDAFVGPDLHRGLVGVVFVEKNHYARFMAYPAQARELADELNKMADKAEGKG